MNTTEQNARSTNENIAKIGIFAVFVVVSILAAGLYGALNDQVTASISAEYYTKFKFIQFNLGQPDLRLGAAAVGFLASWWTALIIAPILGIAAFFHRSWRRMAATLVRAAIMVFAVIALFGLAGFLFGRFYLAFRPPNWWFPPDLVDRAGFVTAGSIHNFSYLGGIAGLALGLFFVIRRVRRDRA